jgi:chromosomal replication initiator protein
MARLGYQALYCTSEQFTNELIAAIRHQTTDQFRAKYRHVDALLIDDIQFISGKESTQEEFFHTFNHLHAAGKQIIISSDRPPKSLATLEERLRSRFEGGIQTDIQTPDFETRVAILQSKAQRQQLQVPYDVLMLLAERVDSNVRELEGALNNLWIQAQLHKTPLTVALANVILNNLSPQRTPCPPPRVVQIVAEFYGLDPTDLLGRGRTAPVAFARHVTMYLLREENGLSLPAIGDQLGGRDHTTVRHGVEKITQDLEQQEALRRDISTLREKLYRAPVH